MSLYETAFKKKQNPGWVLTGQYFEEQLRLVREIRMSEWKFYQKIIDYRVGCFNLTLIGY